MAREMCECPILPALRDLSGLRMNRYHPSTWERPDIGAPLLIQRQVPSCDGLRPVPQNVGIGLSPIHPIRGVIGRCVVRASFGPIDLSIRICLMELAHLIRSAYVTMKCHCIA